MGNCLPCFPFSSANSDDLTRLDNLNERSGEYSQSTESTASTANSDNDRRHSSRGAESSSNDSSRQRYRRNLQPSSYVNELYVSANGGNDDDENMEHKVIDEKRRARVRGLLEQLNVDRYVKDGKGDDECAICMIDFSPNEAIRYLPCMHSYHVTCIDDWLLRSFTCPSCMEPVDSAILSAFTVNYEGAGRNLASLPCSAGKVPGKSDKP